MKYLLLIYGNEVEQAKRSAEQMGAMLKEYGVFTESIQQSGHFLGGERLQRTSAATTVRVRDGKTITTDGPFAETKEQLGGYYVLDCENLDEALAYAAKIPAAENGSIEVRPVWVM